MSLNWRNLITLALALFVTDLVVQTSPARFLFLFFVGVGHILAFGPVLEKSNDD